MTTKRNLVLLTELYPAKDADIFFVNDYELLSEHYRTVYVFPLNKSEQPILNLPKNIQVSQPLHLNKKSKIKLKDIKVLTKILSIEILRNSKKWSFLKKMRYHISEIRTAISMEHELNDWIKENKGQSFSFHSSFMNINSLVLGIASYKRHIKKFTFRINGYDIFNERRDQSYIPFESFIYKQANAIITNSKYSYQYKIDQNIYPEKLSYCHYSCKKQKLGMFDSNIDLFTMVSCSNIIPLKRVQLIAEATKLLNFKVRWVHFGDGVQMSNLKETCRKMPKNINVELVGKTANSNIINFYKNTSVNLFLHTSTSEGLGYALMEAQSFGIPTMACNSGGVSDFVSDDRGVLLPIDISPEFLANEINIFRLSKKNSLKFRSNLHQAFNIQFNNKKIIAKLLNQLER